MTKDRLYRIQDLLINKARLRENENTGIFAFFTHVKEEAEKCKVIIKAGAEKGFKIKENKIHLSESEDGKYLESSRAFMFDSGVTEKIPYQSSQSFGISPSLSYMTSAFYNGEISNRYASSGSLYVFVLVLRNPESEEEVGSMLDSDRMLFKTAFHGKANGLDLIFLAGGDGTQESIYTFDCLSVLCHYKNELPPYDIKRSYVASAPGNLPDDYLAT